MYVCMYVYVCQETFQKVFKRWFTCNTIFTVAFVVTEMFETKLST